MTLIPIRIDIDIAPFRPDPALPAPNRGEFNARVDETMSAYRSPDITPTYRLKDAFLWNLHEALITPDQFAATLVDELDLPRDRKAMLITNIATEIRKQLEEYAGIAMHPLFQNGGQSNTANNVVTAQPVQPAGILTPKPTRPFPGLSREASYTPVPTASLVPTQNGTSQPNSGAQTPALSNGNAAALQNGDAQPSVTATATRITPNETDDDLYSPDDAYRCIISLSINLLNRLYTDKFEWSLLHPPGFPEVFAKQTCADLGLAGEWVPAMTHAIYEAVLRLKKEACENGLAFGLDIDNEAAEGREAGWRYDQEDLGLEWEPKVEILSKEEIENRERDRERQIRRVRRETARFSTVTGMPAPPQNDYFAVGDEGMGRGERSKKKRRFRSLSPVGRETPDFSAYGGGTALNDYERNSWRCAHCKIWGTAVWAVRDGPLGPKVSLFTLSYLHTALWFKADMLFTLDSLHELRLPLRAVNPRAQDPPSMEQGSLRLRPAVGHAVM